MLLHYLVCLIFVLLVCHFDFKELQKLRSAVKRPDMKDVGLQFNYLIPISGV